MDHLNPFLSSSETVKEWLLNFWHNEDINSVYQEALSTVLSRMLSTEGKEQNHNPGLLTLPLYCCSSLGKDPRIAIEVNSAWALLYAAFYLLDKVEDQEITEELFSPSPGVVLNATTGFILSASLILSKIDFVQPPEIHTASALQTAFHRAALAVCAGQHSDLVQQEINLKQVWRTVNLKSGEFFSLGCLLGALIATDSPVQQKAFATYGRHLGILIQIANDIGGLWSKKDGMSDLARGKVTLPVAYALWVQPETKSKRLSELLLLAKRNPDAEKEARNSILECGALVYLMLEAEKHKNCARTALESLQVNEDNHQPLLSLLDQIGTIKEKSV